MDPTGFARFGIANSFGSYYRARSDQAMKAIGVVETTQESNDSNHAKAVSGGHGTGLLWVLRGQRRREQGVQGVSGHRYRDHLGLGLDHAEASR